MPTSAKYWENHKFEKLLSNLRPCRALIQCQIWVSLFYSFRKYHIFIISIINHSQEIFNGIWWPKNSEKPQFFSFLPYLRLYRPLIYSNKYGLFCFNCLNYTILLWSNFVYFCLICSFIEPLYSTKYGLFCCNCLNYILLLWVLI